MLLTEKFEKIDLTVRDLADRTRRFKYVLLTIVVICGLVIRLVAWHNDPVVSRDGVLYLCAAKSSNCNSAALKYYHQGPFLLKAIQIFHHLGFTWENAGVAVNIAAGTLLILATFGAARELFSGNDTAAIASAALIAFNPMLINVSHEIERESLHLLFSTLALTAMFGAARKSSWRHWIFAGIFTALAASSRFEALELLMFAPTAVWFLGDPASGKARFLKIGYYWGSTVGGILLLYCWFGLSPLRFANSVWVRIGNIF